MIQLLELIDVMAAEPFKLQNDYHQRATGFLRQALEFDEQSSI